ncbi:MAG TPA: matrixin family metalloprotease [Candidatus Polarisedimenticolaceae bacterium]|nr:matrixin family metalloprotease [Candidatus Polarisedimenticolaceae bacterium]
MTKTLRFAGIACLAVAVVAVAASPVSAYCLTGVKWGSQGQIFYNSSGKVTSGQCATNLDSAVTGGIGAWGNMIRNAGATGNRPNRRDGKNVLGWAKLGGGTLGVTNYLSYGSPILSCGGNSFQSLFEADVRISTTYRWASGNGACPCAQGSAFFVDDVSTHEFGHVIGLCHSNQPAALMYPSFGVCENKGIGPDDTAGKNALCY